MLKLLAALLLGSVIALSPLAYFLSTTSAPCQAEWEGEIESTFAKVVKESLKTAKENKCRSLRVNLISPGGSVIWTWETARAILAARKDGLLVEIHGNTLVASGATFILAAGSPGMRYLDKNAIYLIHAPRRGGFFEAPTCVSFKPGAKDEDGMIDNELLRLMAQWYSDLSGRPYKETANWVKCDATAIGPIVAVERGLADRIE